MKHLALFFSFLLLTSMSVKAQTIKATVSAEDYPFVVTTDASEPELYYIYSGRDGGGVASDFVFVNEIPWGESEPMLQLMYKNPNEVELSQLWYFMEENGQIKIISAADGRMVTVPNTSDGPKKAYTQKTENHTHAYYTWILDKTGGYYAFKTSDGKSFLSHNGNWATARSIMGLYNADGSKDEGSRIFFEACSGATDISNSLVDEGKKRVVYTIAGQRIENISAAGVYIINGKKRIVR